MDADPETRCDVQVADQHCAPTCRAAPRRRRATGLRARIQFSPILSPRTTKLSFRLPSILRAIRPTDRSWTVLLDVRDHQEQVGLDVEAATGNTSLADLIWVPGEGSSTGNVTAGASSPVIILWHATRRSAARHLPPPDLLHRAGYAAGNTGPSTQRQLLRSLSSTPPWPLALSHLCAPCSTDVTGRKN